MAESKALNDWKEGHLDLVLANNEKPQVLELRKNWAVERLDYVYKNPMQSGMTITFIQGTDQWRIYCPLATHTSMTMRSEVTERFNIWKKNVQGEPNLSFVFLKHRTLPRQHCTLRHFDKYVIGLVILFWNMLELPHPEEIDRIANKNDTCTMRLLIALLDAAYYFNDKPLKDATLNALRRFVKKDDFLFEESLVAVQEAFEHVGGRADEYDLLRKLFLTAAALHTHAFFELSLRQDDRFDNIGRVWKALRQTPAFSKDWEMAVYWYLTKAPER